jgi:hypothetical protein
MRIGAAPRVVNDEPTMSSAVAAPIAATEPAQDFVFDINSLPVVPTTAITITPLRDVAAINSGEEEEPQAAV